MSYIKKNQYGYVKKLMPYINNRKRLFEAEIELQLKEIKTYLKKQQVDDCDKNSEVLKWIDEHGREFRERMEAVEEIIKRHGKNIRNRRDFASIVDEHNKRI
jgi:DNA-binding transcriptional MerR regulator